MPYRLIVLVSANALAAAYVFLTETPLWSKVLVIGVLTTSFVWRYGFFLQVALGICLSLYFAFLKARSE